MENNQKRSIHLENLSIEENYFEGRACQYNVKDSYGTTFVAGCFTRGGLDTTPYSMLWNHDYTRPVGTFIAEERADGLYIKGRWDENTAGRDARAAAISGSASDLSVGFTWIIESEADRNDDMIRTARLQEVSQITSRFAAVPGSELTAVRNQQIDRAEPGELDEGDFVRWDSSGGTAQGRIEHIMTEGTLGIPGSGFAINASEEDPAALIRIYRPSEEGWQETETLVGHRFSTLTKIEPLEERVALGNDTYTTEAEAEAKAEAIGCSGTHSMEQDGQTVYMPCSTHEEYQEIYGSQSYSEKDSTEATTTFTPADMASIVEKHKVSEDEIRENPVDNSCDCQKDQAIVPEISPEDEPQELRNLKESILTLKRYIDTFL